MPSAPAAAGEPIPRVGSRHGAGRAALLAISAVLLVLAFRELASWEAQRGLVRGHERLLFEPEGGASPRIVLGAVLLLLALRRRRLASAFHQGRPTAWGALPLLAGGIVFGWAHFVGARDLLLLALLLVAAGAALVVAGRSLLAALSLPLAAALLAYPPPAALNNYLVYGFQMLTAHLAQAFFHLFGAEVARSGDLLSHRGRTFEVIETCSGIRITQTMILAGLVYLELFRRRGRRAAALLIAAPILGMLANGVRVCTLMLTPDSEFAKTHTLQGILALWLAIGALALLDFALGFRSRRSGGAGSSNARPSSAASETTPARGGLVGLGPWFVLLCSAALAVVSYLGPRSAWRPSRPPWSVRIPMEWQGWKGRNLRLDPNFIGSLSYARVLWRAYEKDGKRVEVLVGSDDRIYRDRSMFSPKNALPGPGWRVVSRRPAAEPGFPARAEELVLASPSRTALAVLWYRGTKGLLWEAWRQAAALDVSPLRDDRKAFVVRISVDLAPGTRDLGPARALLRRFTAMVREGMPGSTQASHGEPRIAR